MSPRTRNLSLAAATLLVVGVVAFALSQTTREAPSVSSAAPSPSASSGAQVDDTSTGPSGAPSGGATSSDPASGTTAEVPVATDPQPAASDPVEVALTYVLWDGTAGEVQASGFVSGLVADGGTCRLTLTRGTETVTAEGPATAGASTTSCGLVAVRGSEVTPGAWDATLSYRSADVVGSSDTTRVEVPVL